LSRQSETTAGKPASSPRRRTGNIYIIFVPGPRIELGTQRFSSLLS
jgi:hypothetical protein